VAASHRPGAERGRRAARADPSRQRIPGAGGGTYRQLARHRPWLLDRDIPVRTGGRRRRWLPNHVEAVGLSSAPQIEIFPDYDLLRQVLVMNRLAHNTRSQFPRLLCWLDRGDDALGTPYFVMEQLPTVGGPGDVPSYHSAGMYLDASPEQRAAMWWGCVSGHRRRPRAGLARAEAGQTADADRGGQPVEQIVDYYSDMLRWATSCEPRAELAAAAKWLQDNI
jgi:hypothetical protein